MKKLLLVITMIVVGFTTMGSARRPTDCDDFHKYQIAYDDASLSTWHFVLDANGAKVLAPVGTLVGGIQTGFYCKDANGKLTGPLATGQGCYSPKCK